MSGQRQWQRYVRTEAALKTEAMAEMKGVTSIFRTWEL